MAKSDLTLREVGEAESYGLTPDQYDNLKTILQNRVREEATSLRKEALEVATRQALEKEKPKIREEVRLEIINKLTEQFDKERENKIRKQIEDEIQKTTPTKEQRRSSREMVHELEIDCASAAKVASDNADAEEAILRVGRKLRWGVFQMILISFLPLLAYLNTVLGWNHLGFAFIAVATTYSVTLVTSFFYTIAWWENQKNLISKLRRSSADYWGLATRAKDARLVGVDAATTMAELVNLSQRIRSEYEQLSRTFQPSAKLFEQARAHVRSEQIGDMDLNNFILEPRTIRISTPEPKPEIDTPEAHNQGESRCKGSL